MNKPLAIHADWDAIAGVWVATSHDVPGLATEAPTVEALVDILETLIPDLLEAKGAKEDHGIAFELLSPPAGRRP